MMTALSTHLYYRNLNRDNINIIGIYTLVTCRLRNTLSMEKTFKEIQAFNQIWLWFILIPLCCIPIYGIYKQLYLEEGFGNNPMSDGGLITLSIFCIALTVFIRTIRLETVIDSLGIKMNFHPLIRKSIKWNEIESVSVKKYGFVGGWGIRLGTKYGTVYNIKGNIGLAVILKDGKKFLIGTQKEEELKRIIKASR